LILTLILPPPKLCSLLAVRSARYEFTGGLMSEHLLTVLKFGSSVLRTENEIELLVEKIHRWSSEKSRVIVVVSAIGKTTDRVMNLAVSYGENFNQEGAATLAST